MDDLITQLRAALNEQAAPSMVAGWHEDFCIGESGRNADGSCFYCGAMPDPAKMEAVPQGAFVLADVAAKRKLLDAYETAAEEDDDYEHAQHASSLLAAIEILAEAYGITT